MNVVEIAVKQPVQLRIGDAEYVLVFTIPAVAWAEERLGRTLKQPADWFAASPKDVPVLLEAGLRKHHPETAAELAAVLCEEIGGAEAAGELAEAMGAANFPRWLARYKETLAKIEAAKAAGRPLPKAEGAADL